MRDYILHLIEQFVIALARAMGLLRDGDQLQARMALENMYRQYLGLPPETVQALGLGPLLALISADPDRFAERAYMLSGMLRLHALLLGPSGAACNLMERALEVAKEGEARGGDSWRERFQEMEPGMREELAALQSTTQK
ncbi:MAG: hypothetical protein K1X75_12940 [Leptospirales bacterium]|nr:hypothetical protein [Leptospirales bacterium]